MPHDVIALKMPQGVVDQLEIIDVQEKQRERSIITAALLHLIVERLLEIPVIIQAGQGIPDGHAHHPVEEDQIFNAGLSLEDEDLEEFGFLWGERRLSPGAGHEGDIPHPDSFPQHRRQRDPGGRGRGLIRQLTFK